MDHHAHLIDLPCSKHPNGLPLPAVPELGALHPGCGRDTPDTTGADSEVVNHGATLANEPPPLRALRALCGRQVEPHGDQHDPLPAQHVCGSDARSARDNRRKTAGRGGEGSRERSRSGLVAGVAA